MQRLLIFSSILLLSACASLDYGVSAKHFSNPSIKNDGYDMGCGNIRYKKDLEAKFALCQNIRGGTLVDVEIGYYFGGQ